ARSSPRWPSSTAGSRRPSTPPGVSAPAGGPRRDLAARRRARAGLVRGLRPVPAALPDLPGDGGGVGVAPRAYRRHAGGSLGGASPRRRFHPLHGPVRAVPGLRGRVPVVGAVRPPHGRGAADAGGGDRLPAPVAATCLPGPGPPP